jgi:hypothetical protein
MKKMGLLLSIGLVFAMFSSEFSVSQTKKPVAKRKYPIGHGRAATGPISAKMVVVSDLAARLKEYKPVPMPFNAAGLTPHERQMIEKLVQASQYLESIFWRQSDPDALQLYQQLASSGSTRDQEVREYLFTNASRFDLLDNNKPFVGTEAMPPGRGFYPADLTREKLEQYVKEHPEQKADIYSGYTIVRSKDGGLETVPYHVAYREFLTPAAQLLREAAALSPDKEFAEFLNLRAEALLTDDYVKSDFKWLDLKNPKIDIVFAPYEVYLDDLLGVKTSYGAAVMIRNDKESQKLALFEKYVPDIQDALPLAAEDRPSKKGLQTPMEVVDAPFRTGDFAHGYQAVADNLPNDPAILEKKGSKKMFFKNFMDARVKFVIVPVAKRLMREDQAPLVTGEAYLMHTMMHEISHGIGPAFARVNGKQIDIREAIGPAYSGLEEAKADVVGMFGLIWLMDHGYLPKEKRNELFTSYVGGLFRTIRFGTAEAHGSAELMEFDYLSEQGVVVRDAATGRYSVNYDKMAPAINSLAKELLEIEATGDRTRAENWFKKYNTVPVDLQNSFKTMTDIPVDITPIFSWPVKVK